MTITTPLRRPWIPRAWVTGLILLLAALLVMAAPSARAADQAPIRTITGGTTGLYYPYGVAVLADGALAVVNFVGNSVTVYAAGADGNVAPIRTIAGTNTGLNRPSGVAVLADGALAISNFANSNTSSVTVYAAGATGNVAPIRTIAGGTTGLIYPVGVAVLADGALAVSNRGTSSSSVTVYAAGADGNVAPIRTIAGGTTGLNTPGGVAVLADGALAVSNGGTPFSHGVRGGRGWERGPNPHDRR